MKPIPSDALRCVSFTGVHMPRYSNDSPQRSRSDRGDSRDRRDPRWDREEEDSEWGNTTHSQRRVSGLRRRNPVGVEPLDGRRKRATPQERSDARAAKPSSRAQGAAGARAAKPAARTQGTSANRTAGKAGEKINKGPRPVGARDSRVRSKSGAPTRRSRAEERSNDARFPVTKRKRTRPLTDPAAEILKLSPRRGARLVEQLHRATDAVAAGRDRDAIRLLRPVRDEVPQAIAVRELLGVALYRVGNFREAKAELETFADLTGSVEQHPVLMDIARAQGKTERVATLWKELSTISPSAALVTEGRIVYAGMLADAGDLAGAIAFAEKGATQKPSKVREHHLRRWYVLGDLYDRSGNVPRARAWFERVAGAQKDYGDVAERLARL